jgi:GntR family transcriptional regulator, transcriptional repressor for pyruvate dehydrogenase complex
LALQQVVRAPVYLQVADQIREAIASGDLVPGEPLPTERDLAEAVGASRASVREALRVRETRGLLAVAPAPGPAVVVDEAGPEKRLALVSLLRLDDVPLDDLIDFRCLLEGEALQRAAHNPDREQLDAARDALSAMRHGEVSPEEFDELDVRFHIALVRASGNRAMHQVMIALRDPVARHLLEALRARGAEDSGETLRRLTAEHAAILEAVDAGRGEDAAKLVERHIRGFYGDVR